MGWVLSSFVRCGWHKSENIASMSALRFFIWWSHREQEVPKHKTIMISSTPGCEVRQELYLSNTYKKARQDVGLFYFLNQRKIECKIKPQWFCYSFKGRNKYHSPRAGIMHFILSITSAFRINKKDRLSGLFYGFRT